MAANAVFDIAGLITSDARIRGGRPCLSGTGVTVHSIAAAFGEGLSVDEIVDQLATDAAHVYAALAFYFVNKASIDADLAADDALYQQLASKYRDGVAGQPLQL